MYRRSFRADQFDSESSDDRSYPILPGIPRIHRVEIKQKYQITRELLGTGTYGKVLKAHDLRMHNRVIAIKKVDFLNRGYRLANEVYILRKLQHRNIITLLDAFQNNGYLYIAMEHSIGDLKQLINKAGPIYEPMCHFIMNQVVCGLDYLHKNDIAHRDLNPTNILITITGTCKIADFGLASVVNAEGLMGFQGTRSYMAPEVMRQGRVGYYCQEPYSERCDIWSLGIMLIELAEGASVVQTRCSTPIQQFILSPDFRAFRLDPHFHLDLSYEIHLFVLQTVVVDPKDRLSAKQLMKHCWLESYRKLCVSLTFQLVELVFADHREVQQMLELQQREFEERRIQSIECQERIRLENRNNLSRMFRELFISLLKKIGSGFCCCFPSRNAV